MRQRVDGGLNPLRGVVRWAAVALLALGLAGQALAQAPTVTGFVGSSNVPQNNLAITAQSPPTSVTVQGTGFSAGVTSARFSGFGVSAALVTSPTTLVVSVPVALGNATVGTTTTLTVCNGETCATGGPAITLTVIAPIPTTGTLTVTPTPALTTQQTTAKAQFGNQPAQGVAAAPGAPGGTVTFASANGSLGTAPLVLDPTATFIATSTTVTVPTAATPVLSLASGTYPGAQSVTITDTTPGAVIYYTTDGSTPNASSFQYADPVYVGESETLTAIAIASGYLNSATAAATYTIFIPIPTSLAFVQQPTTTVTGQAITPSVAVEILDQNGNVITSSTDAISLSIARNPGDAGLVGTTTQNAVNGVATFPNISIAHVATGYTLSATDYAQDIGSVISNAFNIIAPPITITPFATLVGVSSTLPGTFTLGAPAGEGGATVNLASSVTTNVTISPSSVHVAAGGTTGSFTYTGVAPGNSILSASATNYTTGTSTVTATYSLVSLGAIPTIAPGQSVSMALSIATAAPAGGLTVSFTSSNTNVATVTPSITIPAGQRTAAVNPQIVGIIIGSTQITATAPGYAPATLTANVTVTASFSPGSVTIAHQTYSNITLNISAPAQAGGLTFTLSSDTPATATVPASVTIAAGQTSVVVPVTGVADGNTTVRADSPGVTEATLGVSVSSTLGLYYGNQTTGVNMEQNNYVTVPATPASAVTITATIADPTVATLSTSATTVGTASVTYTSVTSTSFLGLYFQGLRTGSTTVTISAPGYTSNTYTVTTYPSGFELSSGSISTTTFSAPTTVNLTPVILNPTTLTIYNTTNLSPGVASVSVPVTSSNTNVGTITTSPVVFAANSGTTSTTFQPTGPGTSTLSIGTPAGYSRPASSTSVMATVTAPQLSFYYGNSTTGVNMQYSNYIYITVPPPSAETFTVTSSNPAVATVSTSSTTVGAATVTYPGLTNAGTYPISIQGQSVGTSTLTVSAPGYTSGTITVTVYPSGFTFTTSGGFSTTTFSTPTSVYVYPSILNPTSLTYYGTGTLNPGVGPISVQVTSSNTNTGTITTSPLTFNGGDSSHYTSFQPSNAGTSTIAIGTVTGGTGFSTPSQYTSETATVTAPQASVYYANPIAGVNMMATDYAYLPQSPPSAETITVTSSNPAVATLSTSSTTVGTTSVTIPGVTSSGTYTFYIQGQSAGTATITVSAPGYTSGTTTVTVYPSGFAFNTSGGLSTTTFSSPSTIYVYPVLLNPSSGAVYTTGTLSPGVSSVSVPVTSSNTIVGTISSSPVVFTAGSSSATTTFQPASAGTSTIAVGTPTGGSGYSTPSNDTSYTATVTAPQLSFYNSVTTGVNMQSTTSAYLPVAPPNPVTVTVVSNGPAIATLSLSPTTVGTSSVTFTNVSTSGYLPTIYVQGQSVGSTTLTVSAAGYSNGNTNVTVDPSGFTFAGNYNSGLSTTSTSSASSLPVYASVLNPGTLTYNTSGMLNPGLGAIDVVVTSSNTGVGTITTSPVVFNAGSNYVYTAFQPVGAGTSNITITQPAGFSTPAQYTGFTATVSSGSTPH